MIGDQPHDPLVHCSDIAKESSAVEGVEPRVYEPRRVPHIVQHCRCLKQFRLRPKDRLQRSSPASNAERVRPPTRQRLGEQGLRQFISPQGVDPVLGRLGRILGPGKGPDDPSFPVPYFKYPGALQLR
ncbi:hypothetical protein GCM10009738_35390 [Kitasatospora viridis]